MGLRGWVERMRGRELRYMGWTWDEIAGGNSNWFVCLFVFLAVFLLT